MCYINDKTLSLTPRGITVNPQLYPDLFQEARLMEHHLWLPFELSQTGSFSSGLLFLNAYNTHMGYLTRNRPAQLRRVWSA